MGSVQCMSALIAGKPTHHRLSFACTWGCARLPPLSGVARTCATFATPASLTPKSTGNTVAAVTSGKRRIGIQRLMLRVSSKEPKAAVHSRFRDNAYPREHGLAHAHH